MIGCFIQMSNLKTPCTYSLVSAVCRDCCIIFSKFCHLEQWKIAQKYKIFAKVGSKFCHIINSYSGLAKTFLKFCLSGKISPNLVTLGVSQKWKSSNIEKSCLFGLMLKQSLQLSKTCLYRKVRFCVLNARVNEPLWLIVTCKSNWKRITTYLSSKSSCIEINDLGKKWIYYFCNTH